MLTTLPREGSSKESWLPNEQASSRLKSHLTPLVSIGILAWNEEDVISRTLDSLLQQSLFAQLKKRGDNCEVIVVVNGSSDRTAEVAEKFLAGKSQCHPEGEAITWRVANLTERGKPNAWNTYVHGLSSPESSYVMLMDADILLNRQDTLWNMLRALENEPEATVTVDRPCKDIEFKHKKTLLDRLSLAMSRMTHAADGQLCGQLYCIRANAARRIYLPRDLGSCEDGFIKTLVCTEHLRHPVEPRRIKVVEQAEHTFEAYVSPGAVLKNQKRQVIGQTILHILVDVYLRKISPVAREKLVETMRANERAEPAWLKRLIAEHVARTRFFWRLHPGLVGVRFRRLAKLNWRKKLVCIPVALASLPVALIASYMAWRSLKAGTMDYWPKTRKVSSGSKPQQC